MKHGTYSTIDCPVGSLEIVTQAMEHLSAKFSAIGGRVRKCSNPHDFGNYPSFEIDYPAGFDDMAEEEQDEWHSKANEIDSAYCKKFAEYL